MKIALVGYGKMGHMIETFAKKRGNNIVTIIDSYAEGAIVKTSDPKEIANAVKDFGAEGVIEFTHPDAVLNNINALLKTGIPIVVGTTGWNSHIDTVKKWAKENNNSLFYAANYSIGVNLFYKIIEAASILIKDYDEYDCAVWEAHHNQKADSPSGTALEIANRLLATNPKKTKIIKDAFHSKPKENELHVSSTRIGSVPGTHTVFFDSFADSIELTHTARSREGFALGAVRAIEWLFEGLNKGSLSYGELYTMEDMLY
ncbi:MAG: 4-hydroxy-tetrahydrodipicolinate reductase [Treponema sp.]|nr:4-hydroxy-tetrahydrodipicolinate reductase [Treponema sp.]